MFGRFTDSARRVLTLAQEEARLLDSHFIGTEHLLLGLIREEDGTAFPVLNRLGVPLDAVRAGASASIGLAGGPSTGPPPFTPRAKKVLELSLREALQLGHDSIGTEHMLLGLVREGEGVGAQLLVGLGIDLVEVRQGVIRQLVGSGTAQTPEARAGRFAVRRRGANARVVLCSFCGLGPPGSGQLVSGDDAFICERCIIQWSRRFGSPPVGPQWTDRLPRGPVLRRGWIARASPDTVTPGGQPADPNGARADIETVFTDYSALSEDGESAIRIENGAGLGWAVAAARANRTTYLDAEIVFTVDDIVFTDPEHAAVWFSIVVNGDRVLTRHRGDAVAVDGEWKMALSTFTQMMAMAGVALPPDHP